MRAAALAGLIALPGALVLPDATFAAANDVVSVASCLKDGFEVKAAFSDNNGGAYLVLQKGTTAYMCHSNPTPRCEKLS